MPWGGKGRSRQQPGAAVRQRALRPVTPRPTLSATGGWRGGFRAYPISQCVQKTQIPQIFGETFRFESELWRRRLWVWTVSDPSCTEPARGEPPPMAASLPSTADDEGLGGEGDWSLDDSLTGDGGEAGAPGEVLNADVQALAAAWVNEKVGGRCLWRAAPSARALQLILMPQNAPEVLPYKEELMVSLTEIVKSQVRQRFQGARPLLSPNLQAP